MQRMCEHSREARRGLNLLCMCEHNREAGRGLRMLRMCEHSREAECCPRMLCMCERNQKAGRGLRMQHMYEHSREAAASAEAVEFQQEPSNNSSSRSLSSDEIDQRLLRTQASFTRTDSTAASAQAIELRQEQSNRGLRRSNLDLSKAICMCVGAVYYKQIRKSEQRPPLHLRTADLVPQSRTPLCPKAIARCKLSVCTASMPRQNNTRQINMLTDKYRRRHISEEN